MNERYVSGVGQARRNRLSAGVMAALGAILLSGNTSASAQEADEITELDKIVVTADRRGEKALLDTPLAISAFEGSWLEERGYTGLNDFIQLSPGVSMTNSPGDNRIQMRGISPDVGENSVGYYLDEVPMAFINQTSLPDVRAFDMERIEVLRGPQGTLYGAGALGGVVRAITQAPRLDAYEFKTDLVASTTKDGGSNYATNLAGNIPLINDRLGLRMAYVHEENSGWIDQTVLGKRDYNEHNLDTFRLKLLGKITDELTVSALYWGSRIHSKSGSASFYNRTLNEAAETPSDYDYDIYNLTFNYDAKNFGVISSTSHMAMDNQLRSDFILGYTLDTMLNPRAFTQEIRALSTHDGVWQWSAGVFYRDSDQTQIQDSEALALFGLDPVIQYDKVRSKSVFAEVTRRMLDGRLELTAGGRFLTETRSSEQRVRPSEPYSNDFDAFTPRVNLTWRPGGNWMTYFNFSQGFRSGINQFAVSLETAAALGVILPAAAEPEYADSYELGIKGNFFDNRLTIDATAYSIKWRDLQTIVPIVENALVGVINASSASSPGMEVALNWRVGAGLRLGVIGSWNDAKIDEDVFADAQVVDPVTGLPTGGTVPVLVFSKGDRINDVPEWTGGLTLDYTLPILNDRALFFVRGATQYASYRERNSFGVVTRGDDILTADLRLGVESGRWGVHLFVNNLFDEKGMITSYESAARPGYGLRGRPRTIGLNFKYNY